MERLRACHRFSFNSLVSADLNRTVANIEPISFLLGAIFNSSVSTTSAEVFSETHVKAAGLILLIFAGSAAVQVAPAPQKIDPPKPVAEKVVTARKYFAEAVALAQTIPELKDEAESISAIAEIEWRSGEQEQAARDFELVRQIILQEAEGENENITYLLNEMDLARSMAGDIDGALKHNSSMNVRERNNLYARVAEHTAETGDLATAFSRLSLMEEKEGSPGQTDILISMFYTALGAGKTKDAMEIAARISDSRFKVEALCKTAGEEAKLGRADEASRTLQEALSLAALQPNVQGGSAAGAVRDDLRAKIAREQAEIGRTSEAFETVDLIVDADTKNQALWQLMEVLANAENVESVRKVEVRISDSAQGAGLTTEVGRAMAKAGDFDGALRIARATDAPLSRVALLFAIAQIRLDKGNRAAALALLQEVTDFANTINDEASKGYFFIEIGQMQLAAGDRVAAVASLAKTAKVPGNFRITPVIVKAQVQAGDIAGALRTAGPPRSEYYNSYYGEIAFAQA
jgi:tetratricopeptide (TPR) repeat protein